MRTLFLVIVTCSVGQACQGALITPLGGSWTDGTTVANYVEVAPSSGGVMREFQALLTVDDNSHVLSHARLIGSDENLTLWIDNTLDFYDGSGQLDGAFELEFAEAGFMRFSLNVDPVFQAWINDTPAIDYEYGVADPGVYTISWTVDTMALNHFKRTTLRWAVVPEPGAVGLAIAGGLLAIFCRSRGLAS